MDLEIVTILQKAALILFVAAGFKWILLRQMDPSTFPARDMEGFERWRLAQEKVYRVLVVGDGLLALGLGVAISVASHRAQLLSGTAVPVSASMRESGGTLAVVGGVVLLGVLLRAAILKWRVDRIERALGVDWRK